MAGKSVKLLILFGLFIGLVGQQQAAFASTDANAQKAFINKLKGSVQKATEEQRLYASLQMAQAIVESGWGESDLAKEANNYFGVKGSYNGQSVTMTTAEYDQYGKLYTIQASFRKYPSAYQSMQDNATLLRQGVSWNHAIYSGTWREKAKSGTQAASGLIPSYATDPGYATKLKSLITSYDLTSLDQTKSVIKTQKNVVKTAILKTGTRVDGMYSGAPYNVSGSKNVGNTSAYQGLTVKITKIAQVKKPDGTNGAQYAYTTIGGKNVWVDLAGFKVIQDGVTTLVNAKSGYQTATISSTTRTDGLYLTAPYSVVGAKNAGNTKLYNGQQVLISKTVQTKKPNGKLASTYAYIKLGTKNYYVDVLALTGIKTSVATLINQQTVNQTAIINATTRKDGLYSNNPYGMSNAKRIGTSTAYAGQTVTVSRYAQVYQANWTTGVKFAYVTISGKSFWIDARALTKVKNGTATFTNVQNVKQTAVVNASQAIYDPYRNNPSGMPTAVKQGTTQALDQQTVTISQYAQVMQGDGTTGPVFAHISVNGQTYWVDKRALRSIENGIASLTSVKVVNKQAVINATKRRDGIYSGSPYQVVNAKRVATSSSYQGKKVTVTMTAIVKKPNGQIGAQFALITLNNQAVWIDIKGLTILN
ncbi:GW dipeptide domain-containing protein [Weissella soli]|uniref:GW dipeptide domain-containing protein n=1 Tax=Weissella soli TaxID=155866 RepID=UPI001F29E565|nr:GW dipeptide domain-containing protein [Weissella soli]GJM48014.1 autolysin [Weissella soli]